MLFAEEGNLTLMRKVKTHKFRYRQTYLRRAAEGVLQHAFFQPRVQPAAHLFGQQLCYRHAQSAALGMSGSILPVETMENLFRIFFRKSFRGVAKSEYRPTCNAFQGNGGFLLSVFEAVGGQVVEDTQQSVFISRYPQGSSVSRRVSFSPAFSNSP